MLRVSLDKNDLTSIKIVSFRVSHLRANEEYIMDLYSYYRVPI